MRVNAKSVTQHGDMITEFTFGGVTTKRILLLRKGAAINFLLGSCPDQTMDLVFAELAAACDAIARGIPQKGVLNEVEYKKRQSIAMEWLKSL